MTMIWSDMTMYPEPMRPGFFYCPPRKVEWEE